MNDITYLTYIAQQNKRKKEQEREQEEKLERKRARGTKKEAAANTRRKTLLEQFENKQEQELVMDMITDPRRSIRCPNLHKFMRAVVSPKVSLKRVVEELNAKIADEQQLQLQQELPSLQQPKQVMCDVCANRRSAEACILGQCGGDACYTRCPMHRHIHSTKIA
jgi:hypothetical protein